MRKTIPLTLVALLVLGAAATLQSSSSRLRQAKVTYKDIAPILKRSCLPCHRGAKAAHGLDLSSYASIVKGDRSGKIVVPKAITRSRLATVLRGKPQLMPPGGELEKDSIEKIEQWIKAGAHR